MSLKFLVPDTAEEPISSSNTPSLLTRPQRPSIKWFDPTPKKDSFYIHRAAFNNHILNRYSIFFQFDNTFLACSLPTIQNNYFPYSSLSSNPLLQYLCPYTHHYLSSHTSFFKDFIYLLLVRGEGREKERKRNINVWLPLIHLQLGTWPVTQACALTGNQTSDPSVRRPVLNPLCHISQGSHLIFFLKSNQQVNLNQHFVSTNKIATYPLSTHSFCFLSVTLGNPCPMEIPSPFSFNLHSCNQSFSLLHSHPLQNHLHCYTNILHTVVGKRE